MKAILQEYMSEVGVEGTYVNDFVLGEFLKGPNKVVPKTHSVPHIAVLDLSNEGYVYHNRVRNVLKNRKDAYFLFAQTNKRFAEQVEEIPNAEALSFHYYLWQVLHIAITEDMPAIGDSYLDREPRKAILCLNNKPKMHRLIAINWLYDNLSDDELTVSLLGFNEIAGENFSKFRSLSERDFPDVVNEEDVVESIERILRSRAIRTTQMDKGSRTTNLDAELYSDTFFSLVTESEMTDGIKTRFTEKSLKPLLFGHPLVVAGNPGTVSALEGLGFDLLRDDINHDYDAINEPKVRLEAVFEECQRLAGLSLIERKQFLQRNRDALQHNIDLFKGELLSRLEAGWKEELKTAQANAEKWFISHKITPQSEGNLAIRSATFKKEAEHHRARKHDLLIRLKSGIEIECPFDTDIGDLVTIIERLSTIDE